MEQVHHEKKRKKLLVPEYIRLDVMAVVVYYFERECYKFLKFHMNNSLTLK